MPIADCEKHGCTWFIEICTHLEPSCDGEPPTSRMVAGMRVCEACIERFGLDGLEAWRPGYSDPENDELQTIYHRFADSDMWTGACRECLDDHELARARASGKPDPFPVYESTLTWRQRDTIAALEDRLERAIQWQPAVSPFWDGKDHLAFWVWRGSLRRPLQIGAYYLTTAAEQDAVEAEVRSFLSDHLDNQAVIRFYEAELWEAVVGAGTIRLPEVLLREVWINCEPPSPS
jgi:hypothetical protein